jgi:hypothetical protein
VRAERNLLLLLLCISAFSLSGCPYESAFPLYPVSEAGIDNEIIGEWEISGPGMPAGLASIYPLNDHEVVIIMREIKKDADDVFVLKGFASRIGDSRFLNVRELGVAPEKNWLFVNYSVSGDALTARTVSDKLFKNKKIVSPPELRRVLGKNVYNKDLYEAETSSEAGADGALVLKRIRK